MGDEKIELSATLGMAVAKSLREDRGIEIELNKYGMLDFSFSEEELSMVRTVSVSNISTGSLDKLEELVNLEELTIISEPQFDEEKNIFITESDVEKIERCRSLKKLTIIGQKGMKSINVSSMRNLGILKICSNMDLENIYRLRRFRTIANC